VCRLVLLVHSLLLILVIFSAFIIRRPCSPTLFPYSTLFRSRPPRPRGVVVAAEPRPSLRRRPRRRPAPGAAGGCPGRPADRGARSEEHTSELQSREKLVCRHLLDK